jgi:hypothetical protein
MGAFYKIIIYDYLQRTRSYAFLLTLAIALYAACSFVPAPGAAYTTVRIGDYTGLQNAAWIGYVTAMMSSVFISMIGFYLVSSGIKKDKDTGVGMIIAATAISNFRYLLAKAWSNFLVLLSILGIVFLMSIVLFFIRSNGYPFQLMQFIWPYLLIPIPAIFFIAFFAVAAEVFLSRYSILMNIGFFFVFCFLLSMNISGPAFLDFFGHKQVTSGMQDIVSKDYHDANRAVSMGFLFSEKRHFRHFEFSGIDWTAANILNRATLIVFGLILVYISSLFFHRFDLKQRFKKQKKGQSSPQILPGKLLKDIKLSELPPVTPSYGIMPFIKTELLMLFRKGPRWLWLVNAGGMIALIFAPLTIAHQLILPCLWFLQVARWSDLATKEKTNRIHYFTYASYKPLTRLLPAQILAGIILALTLALPLMLRYIAVMQLLPVLSIILGGAFIVLFDTATGILSGGKKLFEILFFFVTYLNVERVPFADYFGGLNQGVSYLAIITVLIAFLALISFMMRRYEISHA